MLKQLEVTKLARNAIREAEGDKYGTMYTNKYENCRTVKSYTGKPAKLIRDKVDQLLYKAGSTEHTVKVVRSQSYYGLISSIIVRIPND